MSAPSDPQDLHGASSGQGAASGGIRTASAWARDRRKDSHCAEHGIELARVTDDDLDHAALGIVGRLAMLIGARG